MPRELRPYLPGGAFHITARVAFRQKLFAKHDVRDAICEFIADSLRMTDARLLAFCVMNNHIHLIIAQGMAPLYRLMKPLNTRTALRVKKAYGTQGRVLEGAYHAFPIASPAYLRRVIVYTHLNPYRTRKREDYETYRWSSHSLYAGTSVAVNSTEMRLLELVSCDLKLFNSEVPSLTAHENYLRHLAYWRHYRECKIANVEPELVEPNAGLGDEWYRHSYVPAIQELVRVPKEDLRDLTLRILKTRTPPMELKSLRTRSRNKHIAEARKDVAIAAYTAGHSVAAIAEFLALSSARISQITSRLNIYSPPQVRLEIHTKPRARRRLA